MPGEIPVDVNSLAKSLILRDLTSGSEARRASREEKLKEGLEKAKEFIQARFGDKNLVTAGDPDHKSVRSDEEKLESMLRRSLAYKLVALNRKYPKGYEIRTDAFSSVDYLIERIIDHSLSQEEHHPDNLFKETPLDLVVAILHLTGNDDYLA